MTDTELLEQFQLIIHGMTDMETRLKSEIKKEIQESETRTRTEIKASEAQMRAEIEESEKRTSKEIQNSEKRTQIFVENTITKRLDSLYDGYKLTHDKQWELEQKNAHMQEQIDDLQTRVTIRESQSA